MVVAKFNVTSIEHFEYGNVKLNMQPVMPKIIDGKPEFDNPEDEAFWEATPVGKLEIQITNPHASEQFQAGNKFKVTFERVEE